VTRARVAGAAHEHAAAAPGPRVVVRWAGPAPGLRRPPAPRLRRASAPRFRRASAPRFRRASAPRLRRAPAVLAAALLVFLLAAGPARASEVSDAEFRALAAAAVDDPAALARLRDVDKVGGRAVDVDGALSGARGAALAARLRALAGEHEAVPGARNTRADAREILAESRFHAADVPGPFRGVIRWLRDRVPDLGFLSAGPPALWVALAVVVAGLTWFVARRFLTTRVRASAAHEQALAAARDEDPRALDHRADAAEAAGDLEAALRLRFRAGLLRLDARGAIEFRPSISTFEVRRALHDDDFDALAATFDDVVYGGRPPAPSDLTAARERWPRIVKGSDPSTKAAA